MYIQSKRVTIPKRNVPIQGKYKNPKHNTFPKPRRAGKMQIFVQARRRDRRGSIWSFLCGRCELPVLTHTHMMISSRLEFYYLTRSRLGAGFCRQLAIASCSCRAAGLNEIDVAALLSSPRHVAALKSFLKSLPTMCPSPPTS